MTEDEVELAQRKLRRCLRPEDADAALAFVSQYQNEIIRGFNLIHEEEIGDLVYVDDR